MLIFHITFGTFLLLFGIVALSSKKGGKVHRYSGNLFFFSLCFLWPEARHFLPNGQTMAVHSVYYAATAWAIVLRREKTTGLFEIVAMIGIAYLSVQLFLAAGTMSGVFKTIFYILASVAALAAVLDLNMILRGGLSGKHRIARHAWRTCYALLGAVMSFSANTDKYWPDFINNNALIYLCYWCVILLGDPRAVYRLVQQVKIHYRA